MEITRDLALKGNVWDTTLADLTDSNALFDTMYDVFFLATIIGIMDDKMIETDYETEVSRSIARNTLAKGSRNKKLDILFQIAILSTENVELDVDDRLKLAFEDDEDKLQDLLMRIGKENEGKMEFLRRFANYGIIKISEQTDDYKITEMENLKDYLDNLIKVQEEVTDIDLDFDDFEF